MDSDLKHLPLRIYYSGYIFFTLKLSCITYYQFIMGGGGRADSQHELLCIKRGTLHDGLE